MQKLDELESRSEEIAEAFEEYEPQVEHFNAQLPLELEVKLAAWRRDKAEAELIETTRQRYGVAI